MDYSFFRFLDNFEQAKDLQNSEVTDLNYDMQIHLKPGETYSCITNIPSGIAFDSNYRVFIVDCSNNILDDITDNTFIVEFTHSVTGKQQLKLELVNVLADHLTELVHIRIDHFIVGGKSYWTNPFLISEYDINETTLFAFKHNRELDGTDYKTAGIFQVIRLKCYKQKNSFTDSQQTYTTFDGLKYSSRLIKTKFYNFVFPMCNDFIYDRLQYLFSHDIIYVNKIRVTDKHTHDNSDRYSDTTNVSSNIFKLAVNEEDKYDFGYQIFEDISVEPLSLIPLGQYSTDGYLASTNNSTVFKVVFGVDVYIRPGFKATLYRGLSIAGFVYAGRASVDASGKAIEIDVFGLNLGTPSEYSIVIDPNSIYANGFFNEIDFNGFEFGEWTYSINEGFFNKMFFNNALFNTN